MDSDKKIQVVFYKSDTGSEPVREWLLSLSDANRKIVGGDLKTVEYGWPLGMPTCKKISSTSVLWEVRSNLTGKKNIARVLFCIDDEKMVLLQGFVKKTQKTPQSEIDIALERYSKLNK